MFSKSFISNHQNIYALEHTHKRIVDVLELLRIINTVIKIDIKTLSLIAKNELNKAINPFIGY